jgi:hypothetical protein
MSLAWRRRQGGSMSTPVDAFGSWSQRVALTALEHLVGRARQGRELPDHVEALN